MGNTTEARTIYILLTRSGTWFSRLIHLATADSYTHASIGLDGPIGPFYSFARKYSHFALPAGLVEEQIGPELRTKRQQVPCCLYELSVSPEIYASLRRQISAMYAQRQRYHYNLLGALSCFFNLPLDRRDHYFCSQFVAGLLRDSGALELSKPPALVRPADFCQIHQLRTVHQGDMGACPPSLWRSAPISHSIRGPTSRWFSFLLRRGRCASAPASLSVLSFSLIPASGPGSDPPPGHRPTGAPGHRISGPRP